MWDSEALRYRAEFSHYRDDGDDGQDEPPRRRAPRTGKASVAAIHVQCPDCDALVEGSDGSQMLGYYNGYEPGKLVTCNECGASFKLPRVASLTN